MKKICTIFFLLISSVTNAQSSSANLLELDPNIIAAANCNGALFAVSMVNFENGILNEQRARVMLRTTTLAFWLTATKHQNVQLLAEYANHHMYFHNCH